MNKDGTPPAKGLDWHHELADNRDWMVSIAAGRVGNMHDAEEIVQEASLAVVQQQDRPNNVNNVRSWLYQVIVRRVADHWRKIYRQDALIDNLAKRVVLDAKEASSTESALQDRCENLDDALSQLPEIQERVLQLKYRENLSKFRNFPKSSLICRIFVSSIKTRQHSSQVN